VSRDAKFNSSSEFREEVMERSLANDWFCSLSLFERKVNATAGIEEEEQEMQEEQQEQEEEEEEEEEGGEGETEMA